MSQKTEIISAPDWNRLFEIAASQEGCFTTAQADEAGYSPQLLAKYLKNGRVVRVRHGIYRLVHFPIGEHEELVVIWLWTDRVAVFSHETALMLHGLSDVLPAKTHITLPTSWQKRRLRVPVDVVMHYAEVDTDEKTWFGSVPVTIVERTLKDCAEAHMSPAFVRDAFYEAVERGLIERDALPSVRSYIELFFATSRSDDAAPVR